MPRGEPIVKVVNAPGGKVVVVETNYGVIINRDSYPRLIVRSIVTGLVAGITFLFGSKAWPAVLVYGVAVSLYLLKRPRQTVVQTHGSIALKLVAGAVALLVATALPTAVVHWTRTTSDEADSSSSTTAPSASGMPRGANAPSPAWPGGGESTAREAAGDPDGCFEAPIAATSIKERPVPELDSTGDCGMIKRLISGAGEMYAGVRSNPHFSDGVAARPPNCEHATPRGLRLWDLFAQDGWSCDLIVGDMSAYAECFRPLEEGEIFDVFRKTLVAQCLRGWSQPIPDEVRSGQEDYWKIRNQYFGTVSRQTPLHPAERIEITLYLSVQ